MDIMVSSLSTGPSDFVAENDKCTRHEKTLNTFRADKLVCAPWRTSARYFIRPRWESGVCFISGWLVLWVCGSVFFRPVALETRPGRTSVFLKGSHAAVVALLSKMFQHKNESYEKVSPLFLENLAEVNMQNSLKLTEIHVTSVGFKAPTLVSAHQ